MTSYGIIGIPDEDVEKEVQEKYGKTDHLEYAKQIGQMAGKYTANQPVGWNANSKKRQFRRACKRYLSSKAKEEIKPVGFTGIEVMLFWWIIGGIVSFFTQMMLRRIFNDSSEDVDEGDNG